jgi:hypothetical protein
MAMMGHKLAFGAILIAMFLGAGAYGHDWYPLECCHSMDCAPVVSSSYVAGANYDPMGNKTNAPPLLIVTTKIGTAVVPADLPRRESKDNQMHACMRPSAYGYMYVMCIFMPPGM